MNNKVLIIAGMHRSGTSLITQWLYRCGLHVGDKLLGKGIGNDDGHYEDLEFYSFHRNLLKSKNLPDSGFIENSATGMTENDKSNALKLIARKNNNHKEWGWKDPRTCLFLPDYHELIPEANYIIVYRDFHSTVSSLISRMHKVIHNDDKSVEKKSFFSQLWKKRIIKKEMEELCEANTTPFLKIWILYNQEILKFIDTIPKEKFMVLNYESLLQHDNKIFSRIRNNWNFPLSYVNFFDVYKPALISEELDLKCFVNKNLYEEACNIEQKLKSKLFEKQNMQYA